MNNHNSTFQLLSNLIHSPLHYLSEFLDLYAKLKLWILPRIRCHKSNISSMMQYYICNAFITTCASVFEDLILFTDPIMHVFPICTEGYAFRPQLSKQDKTNLVCLILKEPMLGQLKETYGLNLVTSRVKTIGLGLHIFDLESYPCNDQ